MKYFEIEIRNQAPVTIQVRDTDTPEAWFRDSVETNPYKTVLLGTTSYAKSDILSVREVAPKKGLTNMQGS